MCNSNGLDPETFVEQWMAFSLSHHNGAAPTINLLELMERKAFSKPEVQKSFKDVKDHAYVSEALSHSVYQHTNSSEYPLYDAFNVFHVRLCFFRETIIPFPF